MKALSIRQPWAWLIVNGYKDIENRTWSTDFRGRVYVHTGLVTPWGHGVEAIARHRQPYHGHMVAGEVRVGLSIESVVGR